MLWSWQEEEEMEEVCGAPGQPVARHTPWQSPLLMQSVLGADCAVTAVVGEERAAWLVEIKIRGARPHNRRALHAACLIPRACGSLEFYEESQTTSEPPCLGLVVTIVLANRRRLHESSSSPSTKPRRRFVVIPPHLLIRDMNDSFTGMRGRPAQTMPVLTSKHSPSTVDVRADYVERARGQHKYRVLFTSARRILLLPSIITHDESKLARGSRNHERRRPRELRVIRFNSTCLRRNSHFEGSLRLAKSVELIRVTL